MRENPLSTIFDLEDKEIEIEKFIVGDESNLIYIEIDARYLEEVQKIQSESMEFLEYQSFSFFSRKVKYCFCSQEIKAWVNNG